MKYIVAGSIFGRETKKGVPDKQTFGASYFTLNRFLLQFNFKVFLNMIQNDYFSITFFKLFINFKLLRFWLQMIL